MRLSDIPFRDELANALNDKIDSVLSKDVATKIKGLLSKMEQEQNIFERTELFQKEVSQIDTRIISKIDLDIIIKNPGNFVKRNI